MAQNNVPPPGYLPDPYVPTIELKDGTSLEARAGYNAIADELWIWPTNQMSFMDALTIFSDSNKTDLITANRAPYDHETYEHYTHLITMQEEPSTSKMSIRLRKPRSGGE